VDYAVATLQQSPTGRLTRPLVLLLAYGFQRPMADLAAVRTPVVLTFAREPFTPLRQRVTRKLAWAGAGLSAAAVVIMLLVS